MFYQQQFVSPVGRESNKVCSALLQVNYAVSSEEWGEAGKVRDGWHRVC